jgi:NAD(P)-dependent dehydrogenase (short-subunit alcohol dehydrogenase family)
MSSFDLAGRTVMIAGASSGIGAQFARALADAGAKVVLGARRTDMTAALADTLRAAGCQALAVPMDVTDEASVIAAFNAAEAAFGPIQSVIANAGTGAPGRTTDVPLAKARQVIETNYIGTYTVAREAARRMIANGSRERQDGRIVLISSITALLTGAGDTAYSSSKAAVNHLGKTLAREWVTHGINVNVICPGYMLTELTEDWLSSEQGKAYISTFRRKRLLSTDALDDMVLYFASDASRYVTGAQITIDDGQAL